MHYQIVLMLFLLLQKLGLAGNQITLTSPDWIALWSAFQSIGKKTYFLPKIVQSTSLFMNLVPSSFRLRDSCISNSKTSSRSSSLSKKNPFATFAMYFPSAWVSVITTFLLDLWSLLEWLRTRLVEDLIKSRPWSLHPELPDESPPIEVLNGRYPIFFYEYSLHDMHHVICPAQTFPTKSPRLRFLARLPSIGLQMLLPG